MQHRDELESPILRRAVYGIIYKKLIMSTFQEMLEELPFDKITVAALVKRAGISPNTFYYHYQDIYALLNAWFREFIL